MYRAKIVSLIMSLCIVLTGCMGGRRGADIGAGEGFTPNVSGTLNLSAYSPDTLNPLTTKYSCVRDFLYLTYEGLFVVEEDLTPRAVLASKYSVSSDMTVYRIELKKGIKFHDGSALTAKDVTATFDYIGSYDTYYSDALANVKSYSEDGDYAVKIVLRSPQSNFACNLDFPILPSGLREDKFRVPCESFEINGTGRYKYSETVPYTSIILDKNNSWRDKDNVYIPKVNVRFVNDNDAILYAFDSGETDMVTTERGRWGEFSYTVSHKVYELTTTKYVFVGINTSASAFSDVELRRSLYAHIDKEAVADSIMFSHATPADTPISSEAYFYRNDDEREKAYDKDYIASKKLSTYILYNEESPYKENIAKYLQKQLEAAGVEAELTGVDYETYLAKIRSGDYQLYIGEVELKKDSDLGFMYDTVSGGDEGQNKVNTSELTDFADAKLSDIVNNINTAKNEEALKMAYNNLRLFYRENVFEIPLVHINDALLVNSRIKGKPNVNLTNFYADLGGIYIQ